MRGLLVDDHRLPAPKRTYTGAYTVVFSGVAGSSYTGDIGIDTVRTRPRLLPTKSSLQCEQHTTACQAADNKNSYEYSYTCVTCSL